MKYIALITVVILFITALKLGLVNEQLIQPTPYQPRVDDVKDKLSDNFDQSKSDSNSIIHTKEVQTLIDKISHLSDIDQLAAIFKYLSKLKLEYQWSETELSEFLTSWFPKIKDRLLELFALFDQYQARIQMSKSELALLTSKQRIQRIWEIRYEELGTDFSQAYWADELKNLQLASLTEQIDQSGLDIRQKLDSFTQSLQEVSSEDLTSQESFQQFIQLASIQNALTNMDTADRLAQLRDIRKSLGFDAETVERLSHFDKEVESRWSKGKEYTQKLQALKNQGANQSQLDQLRQEYWGSTAEIIAAEEDQGFYRYERERTIGMN